MSSVVKLISELRKLDIKLYLDGEKLKVNAPSGSLTSEIKSQLSVEKDNIIEFLKHAKQESAPQGMISKTDRTKALPLSYAQHILWVLDQLQPGPDQRRRVGRP